MNKNSQYPSVYELDEVLSNIANRSFLNQFAQSRGIFITNVTRQELGGELSNYFWDNDDLEEIRNEAYQLKSTHALSGFVIHNSESSAFSLKNIYEKIREDGLFDKGLILNKLTKIGDSNEYKGAVEYRKKKVGRIEFLQNEVSSFEFHIKEIDKQNWQVEVDCNRSTDLNLLSSIFEKNLPKNLIQEDILQDSLSNEKAIVFLDSLAKEGMDKEWRFIDIKHLTFRKGKEKKKIDDELEDMDDIEEAANEDLVGISQAILQGQNLRENSFVKDCEKGGYLFTAMTYEFEHLTKPDIIQIKAEFKGRPKVFEVSIVNIEKNIGFDTLRGSHSLSEKDNRAIRSTFWNNAKRIFNELI